ncbi:YciI family protein [Arthrobacter sp. CAL618]|nr:YciI family protein [Arthrobacter sp. CAL618]
MSLTDGPFAETAEQLGGFYVLDVPDLGVAVELVKLLPEYTVELRPITDY